MSSVQVERVADGYVVSRRFSNLAAAQRATDLLLGVCEEAFAPGPPSGVPPLGMTAAQFARQLAADPMRLINPVSQATGD